jgi:hypothetical protein
VTSLLLMERADSAPFLSPPPVNPRAVAPRRQRPTLRSGVIVAWMALILLIPILARGLATVNVDAAASRTTTRSITVSADDVRSPEYGGLIGDEVATYLGAGDGIYPNIAGFRFTGLNIPAGAIIETVSFSLVKVDNARIPLRLDLAFEATDSAAGFSEYAQPGDRICTGTTLSFSEDQQFLNGQRYTVGDPALLAASLQEVIDRTGWRAGNNVVLIAYGPADPAWTRLAFATSDAGPDHAPQLIVTYRMPASNNPFSR